MSRRAKRIEPPGVNLYTIKTVETERGTREVPVKIADLTQQDLSLPKTPWTSNEVQMAVEPPGASIGTENTQHHGVFTDYGNVMFVDDPVPRSTTKSQNEYMRIWRDEKRTLYLNKILERKAATTQTCSICVAGRGVWRCRDCFGSSPLCVVCCREVHARLPFHRVERWNGRFYQKGALWQVGLKLHVGHQGLPCPSLYGDITKDSSALRASELIMYASNILKLAPETVVHILHTDNSHQGPEYQHWWNEVHNLFGPLDFQNLQKFVSMRQNKGDIEILGDELEQSSENTDGSDNTVPEVLLEENVNDDIWEDEVDLDTEGNRQLPRFLPRPPSSDGLGNRFMCIIDITGVHQLPVVWCGCRNSKNSERDLQLLDLELYPATADVIRTAFTFRVLNDHRLESLECKTSTYQYHQKIRRTTSPAFPDSAPNRYPEFRRITRQWRNLKMRKWFGLLKEESVVRGSMALFCPTCPQPGVNLPSNWKEQEATDPNLFMRSLTADGNFKADHVKQRNTEDDVWLTNGESFMTNRHRYKQHLDIARESPYVATCNRYRVQENANVAHNGCDSTGLGGHACARHGCFAPGSLVDFQKGERQMNMDWSFCEALATTNVGTMKKMMHIYDVGCIYHQHFEERVKRSPFLSKPDKMEIIRAIGLFHVHGHQDECLYRYATSYVPGAGVVDGEVLETLWAILNLVSRSTRTATLAHRTEILNDHMGDSNFKKMINIVVAIIAKYRRAKDNHAESEKYFKEINAASPLIEREKWLVEIKEAETQRQGRISAMDYMQAKVKGGLTLREIETSLRNKEATIGAPPELDGTTSWLVSGIKLEEAQMDLQQHVRRLGKKPSVSQQLDLAQKRERLAGKVRTFHSLAARYLGENVITELGRAGDIHQDGNISDDELGDTAPQASAINIEYNLLAFPSMIRQESALLSSLKARELELRKGRANDALQGVRITLGYLSFQFVEHVRTGTTTAQNLRSWDGVRLLKRALSLHRKVYNRCQRQMVAINPELRHTYPPLLISECQMSTAVLDVNARGQSQARLSWIWGAKDGYDPDEAQHVAQDGNRMTEFFRIHWLRARAQHMRWQEELKLTQHEMGWTINFFMFKARQWNQNLQFAMQEQNAGFAAYCQQQTAMWNELGRLGDEKFKTTRNDYFSSWTEM